MGWTVSEKTLTTIDTRLKMSPAYFPKEEASQIQDYFDEKTIFITGGTGFLGKLIVEKLLRTCPGVRRIYLLVREKKGVDPHDRLKETFNMLAFEPLKSQFPDFLDKLTICIGDCMLPNLGLSPIDQAALKEEVNCVLHCAATVRFDASLRKATYSNVRATRDLLRMAKEMKRLTSFVVVSTAYSNCPRDDIDEVFYESPIAGEKLIGLVDLQEDELLDAITPALLGKWPNTYSFTKAVAEGIVKGEAENLPVAVVRPSIITTADQEPLPGWVDNVYGLSGAYLGLSLGLMRTLRGDKRKAMDIVPVDYVVNAILAAAWSSSERCKDFDDSGIRNASAKTQPPVKDVPIYNYVSGPQNLLTWEKLIRYNNEHIANSPISSAMWYVTLTMVKNKHLFLLLTFLLHTIPAYIADFFLICFRKKPMLKETYKKIDKFSSVISYFCMREWQFKNDNTKKLWGRLTPKDKELFNFDISKLVWYDYSKIYVEGFRVYLLKDPLDTVPKARRRFLIFKVAHYILLTLFWLGLLYLVMLLLSALISL